MKKKYLQNLAKPVGQHIVRFQEMSDHVHIGNGRNVRELGKSMVVFRLFEKLKYSNERSTNFESLNHE